MQNQESGENCEVQQSFSEERIATIISDQNAFNALLPDIVHRLSLPETVPMRAQSEELLPIHGLRTIAQQLTNRCERDVVLPDGDIGIVHEYPFGRLLEGVQGEETSTHYRDGGDDDIDISVHQEDEECFLEEDITRKNVVDAIRNNLSLIFDFSAIDYQLQQAGKECGHISQEVGILYREMRRAHYQIVLALIPDLRDDEAGEIFDGMSAQDVFNIAHGNLTIDIGGAAPESLACTKLLPTTKKGT